MAGGHHVIIFGFLPQILETKAVAVAFSMAWPGAGVESPAGGDQALGLLAVFRGEWYRCLTARADALLSWSVRCCARMGRCECWRRCYWSRSIAGGQPTPRAAWVLRTCISPSTALSSGCVTVSVCSA
jgi:hypothetical protein